MKKTVIIAILMGIFISCRSSEKNRRDETKEVDAVPSHALPQDDVVLGAERLTTYLPMLLNKKVGLVVNQTSEIQGVHLVDTLQNLGVNVIKVFAPEHGFRGDHSAGAVIDNGFDKKTGLPIVSLYGSNKKPSAAMLQDLDVVIFDIQDVGVRFYTYISTMHYVMEACAEQGKQVVVLDRPNPNGFYIDGPVLQKKYKSFIGMHAIPLVHGLTVGELALMINGENWLKGGLQCDLQVVSCENYDHQKLYALPIKPSPNLPNMNSVYLYPYLGLFEGTNVSIGRGTDKPFQMVGRPGQEDTFSFTPRSISGVSENPKYKGQECRGEIVLDVSDSTLFQNPKLNLAYLIHYYETNGSKNGTYFKDFFYKLAGNAELRTHIEQGMTEDEIRNTWQADLDRYKDMRKKYLLYP